MSAPRLEVQGLACGHDGRTVVRDVSFTLSGGEFLCLLGPNGAGKTTLFKTLLRLLPSHGGRILIEGEDVESWSRRRFATFVGYVPQAHVPPFAFSVAQVVAMGRTAHLGPLAMPGRRDRDIAEAAMDSLGIAHLAPCACTEISGGERQLMLLARALAQQPRILVLDEPTSALDFGNQVRVLDHVARLAREAGMAVVMTTHDPNHALRHATRVAAIGRGGSFAVGRPAEMVSADYLRETYDIEAHFVETHLADGITALLCLPLGRSVRPGSAAPISTIGEYGCVG
jgi:iron complex transport system ATP-binding protein